MNIRTILTITVIYMGWNLFVVALKAQSEEPRYAGGEGYTSANLTASIEVGARMFSAPDNLAMCAALPKPTTLITNKNEYIMKVGDIFSPEDLKIVAVDSTGKTLKPIPIDVSVGD